MKRHNTPRRVLRTITRGALSRKDDAVTSTLGRKGKGKRFAAKADRRAGKAICRQGRDD